MNIVSSSDGESWYTRHKTANIAEIVERIVTADIVLADLDRTDAFPGKELALSALETEDHLYNPNVWRCAFEAAGLLALHALGLHKENPESKIFRSIAKHVLYHPKELKKIKQRYTPENVAKTFFKDVLNFYKLLSPDAVKIYVTRNIPEVAEAYMSAAGFNGYMACQFDKRKSVEEIVKQFPDKKRFVVRGDSADDEVMADYLREFKKEGRIDSVTYINVAKYFGDVNPRADINVSRYNQDRLNGCIKDLSTLLRKSNDLTANYF